MSATPNPITDIPTENRQAIEDGLSFVIRALLAREIFFRALPATIDRLHGERASVSSQLRRNSLDHWHYHHSLNGCSRTQATDPDGRVHEEILSTRAGLLERARLIIMSMDFVSEARRLGFLPQARPRLTIIDIVIPIGNASDDNSGQLAALFANLPTGRERAGELEFDARNEKALEALSVADNDIPDVFKCAITLRVMDEPVKVPGFDGAIERAAILHEIAVSGNADDSDVGLNPYNRELLRAVDLVAQPSLKASIEDFVQYQRTLRGAAASAGSQTSSTPVATAATDSADAAEPLPSRCLACAIM